METAIGAISYPVVETFHSVQGEGYWTGVNAFFIRLGGCDVHCPWCDTKHSWSQEHHPQKTIPELVRITKSHNSAIVIITGGEPLIHNLLPLTSALKNERLQVHLETSGAHPFSGNFDWVTFSPKQFKKPHPSIYKHARELKVVISNQLDIQWAEKQAAFVSNLSLCYLQPEWNSPQSKALVFDYVLKHPNWRISLQTHKLLQIQ